MIHITLTFLNLCFDDSGGFAQDCGNSIANDQVLILSTGDELLSPSNPPTPQSLSPPYSVNPPENLPKIKKSPDIGPLQPSPTGPRTPRVGVTGRAGFMASLSRRGMETLSLFTGFC